MGDIKKVVYVALGLSIAGCSMESGESAPGVHPDDVKPEDGSELAADLGTVQDAHAQHYVDSSNLWGETAYPMGTTNPNCMDWSVYDRYLAYAPPKGVWSYYSTYHTSHPYAGKDTNHPTSLDIREWLESIPPSLGWSSALLIFQNSVVDRTGLPKAGKCTGRYVFQWDNHDAPGYTNFLGNQYWVQARIPQNVMPDAPQTACSQTAHNSVPSAWVDLYVCEAPLTFHIGSLSSWCAVGSGNWRRFGGSGSASSYSSGKCTVVSSYYYTPPPYTAAVSFNLVVKTGVGHGVAPAEIAIYRSN